MQYMHSCIMIHENNNPTPQLSKELPLPRRCASLCQHLGNYAFAMTMYSRLLQYSDLFKLGDCPASPFANLKSDSLRVLLMPALWHNHDSSLFCVSIRSCLSDKRPTNKENGETVLNSEPSNLFKSSPAFGRQPLLLISNSLAIHIGISCLCFLERNPAYGMDIRPLIAFKGPRRTQWALKASERLYYLHGDGGGGQ